MTRDKTLIETSAAPDCELIPFLRKCGLLGQQSVPSFTALSGGVASDIWLVQVDSRFFVVKRALARLRVVREWTAPTSRNASEVEWMLKVRSIAPDAVPQVLAHEPAFGAFAMEYLDPATYPVWKTELKSGRVDPAFAAAVGYLISTIHAKTADDPSVKTRFCNDEAFHSLRMEPYFEAVADAHPTLARQLRMLSDRTLSTKVALVHGDVSPKNILVGLRGPILLDAECACYGDPAFDLAFCLNHLLLKCLWVPSCTDLYLRCFDEMANAYLTQVAWEQPTELEQRCASLLAGLLLGRIDGKSPIEYVTSDRDRSRVRRTACALIEIPSIRLDSIRDAWAKEMKNA